MHPLAFNIDVYQNSGDDKSKQRSTLPSVLSLKIAINRWPGRKDRTGEAYSNAFWESLQGLGTCAYGIYKTTVLESSLVGVRW